jgi:hypothetical protein
LPDIPFIRRHRMDTSAPQEEFDFSYLPNPDAVLEWAKGIVAQQGDAFVNWLHKDGLYVADSAVIGHRLRVLRENVARYPADGRTNIARIIQVATYPEPTFAEPFWHHPDRSPHDVPMGLGNRRYNEIDLPEPGTTMPLLVRVVMWNDYVPENPEGQRIHVETVEYTLHPIDASLQAGAASADAKWAARGEKLAIEYLERRRKLLAARQRA